VFETGVPPQYRIYGYLRGSLVKPEELYTSVVITRLGREPERFEFEPAGEFLVSTRELSEPHSFDVRVEANFQGRSYRWEFSSVEGRTEIADTVAAASGLRGEAAQSRELVRVAQLRGKVIPKEKSTAQIIPRFSGILREVRKQLGEGVQKGEVVAVVESNESLQPFEVRSPLSGTVTASNGVVGEFLGENRVLFQVQTPGEVWGEFLIPLTNARQVDVGQTLHFTALEGGDEGRGTVSFRAPYVDEETQSQIIRISLPEGGGRFLPGTALLARVPVESRTAAVAVRKDSVFSFRDWKVVFRKVGTLYEATPVQLGMSDGEFVEVLAGLHVGEEYVTENAFLIKADILKSGASHDH
jgi:cobalt-zinc-cadmium efflux system membrane fusion protein